MSRRHLRLVLASVVLAVAAAACSDDAGDDTTSGEAATIRVPEDHATIQGAVDDAEPGDLVLIGPGEYHEAVVVRTPDLVVRGVDRNDVVLDGGDELGDGITVHADGVAVENLTVRNYRFNGVLIVPAEGGEDVLERYRVSFVTAANNGLYGLYAFRARGGVFEDSYASGHPDSGFYIGQCDPCDAVVRRVVAEHNVVGFQGTNASGDLLIVESTWRANRVGIQPNSDTSEGEAPQHDAAVVGNVIADNDSPDTPVSETGDFGYGIALGGSLDDVVERNLVTGHDNAGIALLAVNDGFRASGNRVRENVLRDNGFDLVYLATDGEGGTNCFEGNEFTTSFPEAIETAMPCDGAEHRLPGGRGPQLAPEPPGVDHRTLPLPPDQASMPRAATAPPRPATGMPDVDLDAIPVPAG